MLIYRFGNRITIEKKITNGSGGHWKLYNSSNKVVTEHKPEAVLKQLSVNAANPLTIITQDMARAFLSGGWFAVADQGERCRSLHQSKSCLKSSKKRF